MKDGIYRNTCPRNCYGTCSMLSYVENDRLIKVTGDPLNGYTGGHLCAKGYAYTQFVYNPQRLKYPMLQSPRGSGNWKRISWEEAYTRIASKMIELNQKYGSNLASGYNKFSGNLGLLHYATEGMFNSIGPHTKPVGNPCALTGKQAIYQSLGQNFSCVPEDMAEASLIVIWGANPAVTNVHQMKFIYEARKNKGAKLVVIDPIFTQTAKKADLYIQINPSSDAMLAYGIAKRILEKNEMAVEFLSNQTEGWNEYERFLLTGITVEMICERTGVSPEAIEELSNLYGKIKPAVTWPGLGIQRNSSGGDSIAAITNLAAITGNLNIPNAGIYYMHFEVENFPLNLLNHQGPAHLSIPTSRKVDISDFAKSALTLTNPPLKLLWIASRNVIAQDQNLKAWEKLFEQLELIVTVDLYMTKTAEQSDLVLPAATHFEEEDLNVGYWHYWLSLNQQAIPAYYEAKSDLQIARDLTRKLNKLSPGFSNFPADKEPVEWVKAELTPEIRSLYSFNEYEDLLKRPYKKKEEPIFTKRNQKFQFILPSSKMNKEFKLLIKENLKLKNGEFLKESNTKRSDQYRLLSPQSLLKIHSQYESLSWLNDHQKDSSIIEISSEAADLNEIKNNEKIELFNDHGRIVGTAFVNNQLPRNVVLANQAGYNPINKLIIDNRNERDSVTSTYFYDSFVQIRKRRESHV
ncbi:molybdopterin-dependent oxidoreductase [Bacillus sp. B15-48]|nr:molybdopterin-dependent oxidoreductase [Bacillus sp. B15-48]MBM4763396.1 molybdopterin-dependent oxidoreductase [Bacillus sp. B15-48]